MSGRTVVLAAGAYSASVLALVILDRWHARRLRRKHRKERRHAPRERLTEADGSAGEEGR